MIIKLLLLLKFLDHRKKKETEHYLIENKTEQTDKEDTLENSNFISF
jgi:hypothetical protein